MARHCSNCGEAGHYAKTCPANSKLDTGLVVDETVAGAAPDEPVNAPVSKSAYISHKVGGNSYWGIKSHPKSELCEHCETVL